MQRVVMRRAITLALCGLLLSAVGTGAPAQPVDASAAPPAPLVAPVEVCAYTYDQWQQYRGGNFQSPWTRSLPSEIVASYFSTTRSADEFVPINHHNYYITLKITGYCAEHAIRWLQEALAYGDIIVPLGALRDQPPIYYFVTHIGRPQDWVEAYLRDQFEHFDIPVPDGGYQQLTDKEIDRIVVASRTVDRGAVAQSLVAAAAALPELTYEEWRAG